MGILQNIAIILKMSETYGFLTVTELKSELRKRNAKVTGKKEALIERLIAYDRNNNFGYNPVLDDHTEEVLISAISWPPNDTFTSTKLTSILPPIDIVHINNYVLKAYQQTGLSMYAAVHRKGYNMMLQDFLLALVISKNELFFFFKAQVASEMTKSLSYHLRVAISIDGSITEASCECIAGKGFNAVCKHVVVVCYAILHLKEHKVLHIKKTCTETKQEWHLPKKRKLDVSPKKAHEIDFNVCTYDKKKRLRGNLCYDPRPERFKNVACYTDNVRNQVINYTASKNIILCINGSFPVASVVNIGHDHNYLKIPYMHQMVYNRIQVTESQIKQIEKNTRSQSLCSTWFRERSMRLTASIIGTIVHMTERKNKEGFVRSIIEPKTFHSAAADWGKINEKNAISAYETTTNNKVMQCGIFISQEYPFLAGSPDGLVGSKTVLEVKCPYSIRNSEIHANLLSYLENRDDVLTLKPNSNYYYQVQTQMFVTGRNYCDFVIWTTKDYKCISVNRNDDVIIKEIIPKAKEFFDKFLVVALGAKYFGYEPPTHDIVPFASTSSMGC